MKKNQTATPIENTQQFLNEIKQHMKTNNTNKILFSTFRDYKPNNVDLNSLIGRIMQFINGKTKFRITSIDSDCQIIFKQLIEQDKVNARKFKVQNDGILYLNKYNDVTDEKSLLQQIQRMPEGLLVDDELLKYRNGEMKGLISALIEQREIIPVRSKLFQKSKAKQNGYEGYLLFPFPSQLKEIGESIFQPIDKSEIENEGNRQKRFQKIFSTKTVEFRKEFQKTCSENLSKGQEKSSIQNSEIYQNIYNTWSENNKKSVPNFDQQVEEWFKNRK